MELWDAYDRSWNPTGETIVRDAPIPEGRYHLVCTILVRHTDGDYLLMKRDPQKPLWPGYYEATAGGAVQKGESLTDGARRELREETGIEAKKLTLLERSVSDQKHSLYGTFLCETDVPKDGIRLQEGETVGWLWVSREEAIRMMQEKPGRCVEQPAIRRYFGLDTPDSQEERLGEIYGCAQTCQ